VVAASAAEQVPGEEAEEEAEANNLEEESENNPNRIVHVEALKSEGINRGRVLETRFRLTTRAPPNKRKAGTLILNAIVLE
jgi:hypothetical protein